jgi:alkanesulfonate monooxygenase SsuD/methylene tetrahydromethanopterin reductase-like flavin-dependent oxidoreductase (luciferase family)
MAQESSNDLPGSEATMRLTLRYDMRQPDAKADFHAFYENCIEQCVWADRLGFEEVFIGEHHGAEDGYIPSSIVLAAAIAARTKNIKLHLSALILTMHHPLRLAEDIAILDIVSNGRVKITAGMGYRPHEFEMMGVDFKKRLRIYLDTIETLQKAWTGQPFEFEGRTVHISPLPVQKGGPKIIMGGSAEAAAERAARMGLEFMPGHPALYENYKAERAKLELPPPAPLPNFGPTFLYVTHDPAAAWPVVGPHVLYTTNSYAQWAKERGVGATLYVPLESIEELKSQPIFQVVTPEQCVAFAKSLEPHGELQFQPLFGGLDPKFAWRSLELFESEVLPRMKQEGLR